jgi:hypothetical protein
VIIFCNLSARSFVSNFREEFNIEMGPKSPTEEGESVFGTRVIYEELILLRQTFPSKNSLQSL